MLIEGVKLMFIGMATVLLFITFMIMLIQLVSVLTKNIAENELKAIEEAKKKRAQNAAGQGKVDGGDVPIAVITAAIAAYEEDKLKQN